MPAYAADYNEHVEKLRDHDSASWTPTNSVATSNHLNGTAMDLNWELHPFRVADAGFTPQMIDTMNELLEFYEGTMFWANNWDSPKDAMHHQMGYDSFNNPHTADFIKRKIRSDGFSTFRRGDTPAPPPSPPAAALILADAMGKTVGDERYAQLLPAVSQALNYSQCTNLERITMWMAQIGEESGGLRWMEEIASGGEYEGRRDLGNTEPGDGKRFKGRGPIQVTGRHNYTELSKWAFSKHLIPSPTFFVDNPAQLSSDQYGFLGAIWYWTVARPQINSMCDNNDLEGVTRAINGGLHGLDERRRRWGHAKAMGDSLLQLLNVAPIPPSVISVTPAPPSGKDNFLYSSRAALRPLGQGDIGNLDDFLLWTNGSVWDALQMLLAQLRYPPPSTMALLHQIAEADPVKYPDRQEDKKLARAILADLADHSKPPADTPVAEQSSPSPTPIPLPALPPPPPPVLAVVEPQSEPVEVLPAVPDRYVEPAGNTPQDLINTVNRLKVFDTDYRQAFDNLTKGSEEK